MTNSMITFFIIISGLAMGLALWPLHLEKKKWILGLILLLLAIGGYLYWGSWKAQVEFAQQQKKQQAVEALLPQLKDPNLLIKKLQTHLNAHPNSARGWYLLGRLYASQQRWPDAMEAFHQAYLLQPNDESIAVNYAQGLLVNPSPEEAESARHILLTILETHPQQADALLLLALEAQRRQDPQQALLYWRRLLLLVPEASSEAQNIRNAIQNLQK